MVEQQEDGDFRFLIFFRSEKQFSIFQIAQSYGTKKNFEKLKASETTLPDKDLDYISIVYIKEVARCNQWQA